MGIIEIDKFPFPPSENEVYSSNGRFRFANKKLKDYKSIVLVWRAMNIPVVERLQKELSEKKVGIRAYFHYRKERVFTKDGSPKRNDVTNRIKPLQDCLFEIIGSDDKWVFEFSCKKLCSEDEPYVRLELETL